MPAERALNFVSEIKDHAFFSFNDDLEALPLEERLTFIKEMKDHDSFDFNDAVRYLPKSQKVGFAASMKDHPKFSFYDAVTYIPGELPHPQGVGLPFSTATACRSKSYISSKGVLSVGNS